METVIKNIANGLRHMETQCDGLIFIDKNEDWQFDLSEICGLPVIHTSIYVTGYEDKYNQIYFIPYWNNVMKNNYIDIDNFLLGYNKLEESE